MTAKAKKKPLGLEAYQREYARLAATHEWMEIFMCMNGKGDYLSLWLNGVRYV